MDNFREEVRELQIGFKIRRMRQDRRMTLQDLADATGLSKPLLSQIENEQVIPPLATLLRIAKAFRVNLHSFFQEEGNTARCVLTKAGESRRLTRRPDAGENPAPYTYHSLASGKKNRSLEPFIVEFDVREWRDDLLVNHDGEEFIFLLEGELELRYADQVYQLEAGDSVYYDSTEPHAFLAKGEKRPRAVAVVFSRD